MDAILFDLDNTLYPPERRLFSLIDVRINSYMEDVVGIPSEDVDGLRRRYWADYGVTLQGLIRHWGVDPEDYLHYVHDVEVDQCLTADPGLRKALEQVNLRRMIFTNGSIEHANRVLGCLGLADLFERIFDIRIATYRPKPFCDPYHRVLASLDLPADRCLMVEDTVVNLRTAKELGMGTILVGGSGDPPPYVDVQVATAELIPSALSFWKL